ncbi:MAG: hypothetical protein HRT35_36290, partial [Algicola sp.]|nr:hypothetical protein [Algicola sp.]
MTTTAPCSALAIGCAKISTILNTQKQQQTENDERTDKSTTKAVFQFDNIGEEQGLLNLWVLKVLQDPQGYIWVATQLGLYRYDGYDFKVFMHDPEDPGSLANNYTVSLFEDNNGTLWVGTQGGVLHKYSALGETFTRLPFDKDYPNTST